MILDETVPTETVFSQTITERKTIEIVPSSESTGIFGTTDRGRVFSVSLDKRHIVPYLLGNQVEPAVAIKLARKVGMKCVNLYQRQFDKLLHQNDYVEAAKLAVNQLVWQLQLLNKPSSLGGRESDWPWYLG